MLLSCRQINREASCFTSAFTTLYIAHFDPRNAYWSGFNDDGFYWIGKISDHLEKEGRSFHQVRELYFPCAMPRFIKVDVVDGREKLHAMFPALERLVLSDEHVPEIDDEGMSPEGAEAAFRLLFKKPNLEITRRYTGCEVLRYFHPWTTSSSAKVNYHWKDEGCTCTTQKCTAEMSF